MKRLGGNGVVKGLNSRQLFVWSGVDMLKMMRQMLVQIGCLAVGKLRPSSCDEVDWRDQDYVSEHVPDYQEVRGSVGLGKFCGGSFSSSRRYGRICRALT